MKPLHLYIEALIFASENPVTIAEMEETLRKHLPNETFTEDLILSQIELISEKYATDQFAFEIRNTAGGFQFFTKPDFYEPIASLLNIKDKKKLSGAALEALAIIAYKQPVSKAEVEQIRGVNSDYSIQKLLEKDLIRITPKKENNAMKYEVSQTFLDYFGLNSTNDLPKLKDIQTDENNSIGEQTEL